MAIKRKWVNRFLFDEDTNILQIELEKDGKIYRVYTTYIEKYVGKSFLDDIQNNYWVINSNGYPYCEKLKCSLHYFVMKKWYGESVCESFLKERYVVDHIDNNRCNAQINNLEFLTRDMNTAKGQVLDKDIPTMRGHIALSIYKDFSSGEYQITMGINDFNEKIQLITLKGKCIYEYVDAIYLTYDPDVSYDLVILDATKILKDYQKNFRINLRATSASREKGWLRKQAIPYIDGPMKEGEVRKYVRFHKVAPKFE